MLGDHQAGGLAQAAGNLHQPITHRRASNVCLRLEAGLGEEVVEEVVEEGVERQVLILGD